MAEKGSGAKIFSNTVKRARRVQEKMLQKLGKSDQTKDEVFQDFVNNFNRQSTAAHKLQKELTRFMNAVRVLNQCTCSLGETLKELYEPGWAGCDKYGDVFKTRCLLWEDQLTSLQSKMVEPINNYISRFPEVKSRIQKRERKVVDYDLRRRELEALKTKQKVTDQKLQQAEDSYSQAKQLYDEITDELYEELPSFFDSRIQFYAAIFQSIAATESRFHSEMAKVDEEFAGLMDGLANEAATAIHTTKKERALDSTPKLLSRPGENSDSDGEVPTSPQHFSSTSTGDNGIHDNSIGSTPSSTPTHPNQELKQERPTPPASDGRRQQPPSKPFRSSEIIDPTPSPPTTSSDATPPETVPPASANEYEPVTVQGEVTNGTQEQAVESPHPVASPPPEKPKPLPRELSDADLSELDAVIQITEKTPPTSTPTTSKPEEADPPSQAEPDNFLYKVVATHPYVGEDEDELSFEKGDIIMVVPYSDPEDEEEGWATGIIAGTIKKGIFPGNFTKRLD